MTRTSMLATLLAVTAAFGLACGTAFAGNDRVPDAATGYMYPDFWGETPTNKPVNRTAAHQGDGPSVNIYVMHHSTGTYLFPPNPFW